MVLWNVGTYYNTIRRHNSEDLDLNLRRRKNLRTRSWASVIATKRSRNVRMCHAPSPRLWKNVIFWHVQIFNFVNYCVFCKEKWGPYLHSPNTPSWRGDQLREAQGQFTFTFTITCLCACKIHTTLSYLQCVFHVLSIRSVGWSPKSSG